MRGPNSAVAIGVVLIAGLATACGSSSKGAVAGSPTGGSSVANPSPSAASRPATNPSTPATSPSLTESAAALDVCHVLPATAVAPLLGVKSVTASGSPSTIPGLSLCSYAPPATGIHPYPVQVSVTTNNAAVAFAAYRQAASDPKTLSGIGDQAYSESSGVCVLSGSYFIQITGPAGPVLAGDFAIPTAIARSLVAALR